MRKESWNIAIACFIGGMLGVLVGVTIAKTFGFVPYTFMWYIAGFNGAFIGGIAAYFAYRPSVVLSALRRAWRELADVEQIKRLAMNFLSSAFMTIETIFLFVVVIAGFIVVFLGGLIAAKMGFWGETAGLWYLFGTLPAAYCSMEWLCRNKRNGNRKTPPTTTTCTFREGLRGAALCLNPIVFPCFLVYGTVCFLGNFLWNFAELIAWLAWRTPKALWRLAVFSARFARAVFVLIHSDERTICFVDTFIGAATAYILVPEAQTPEILLGAMFAGGILGLALGVLNYELISVRLLKLAPARVRK